MSHSLNSLKGFIQDYIGFRVWGPTSWKGCYIRDYIGGLLWGLLREILGIQTMAQAACFNNMSNGLLCGLIGFYRVLSG